MSMCTHGVHLDADCLECKAHESTAITEASLAPPPVKGAAANVEVTGGGVLIKSLDDLLRFARMAVSGGAAPKGMSEGAAAIAIQAGMERGLGVLGGLTQGLVINGVFSWRGQGAVALIQNSGQCLPGSLRFGCEGEGDDRVGYAVAHRAGYMLPDRREFSVKDAKRARLWGKHGPWTEYPERQLAWRAVGFLARDIFPDVLGGFPLAEEATDFEERGKAEPSSPSVPTLPAAPDPLLDAIEGGSLRSKGELTHIETPAVNTMSTIESRIASEEEDVDA